MKRYSPQIPHQSHPMIEQSGHGFHSVSPMPDAGVASRDLVGPIAKAVTKAQLQHARDAGHKQTGGK